ncbi:MAG: hypothetical protein UMR38_01625 [Candidatus Izemoplasma sp.]|nr:hypothetical protein [Candidatus Izemoplasma sp.]
MKRITIIAGHYGSGKSEISVELALTHKINYLVDLDIINVYFRSRELDTLLKENDIHLVESTIKGMRNSDLPFVSGEGAIPFTHPNVTAIYDLGGTENGVRVLHQFLHKIKDPDEIDFLVTVNTFRPETQTKEDILKTIAMYEAESQLKVTGLINNTNLMQETTEDDILNGEQVIASVARELHVPIVYTAIDESIDTSRSFKGEKLILHRYIAKQRL